MLNTLGLVLVCLTAASPAGPIKLQRLGEITHEAPYGLYCGWLDAHRYVHVNTAHDKPPKGRSFPSSIFVIADVRERKVLRIPFRSSPWPAPEMLFFKDDLALMQFRKFNSAGPNASQSFMFCFWHHRASSDCHPTELDPFGTIEPPTLFYSIGPDPTGRYFYFAAETRDPKRAPVRGPLSIRLLRISLSDSTPAIDWEMELVLPKRAMQLEFSERVFSPDGKKLALVEYHDRSAEQHYSPVPPPQVYVIDLETKETAAFPSSFTPYGLTFSRDGRYLAVGSYETGEIIRINLAAGKIDGRVKTKMGISKFFVSPKGGSLLVFRSQLKGWKPLEVRRWKDLKSTGTIPIRPLLPELEGRELTSVKMASDGRHLVATLRERNLPGETLVVFEVQEQ